MRKHDEHPSVKQKNLSASKGPFCLSARGNAKSFWGLESKERLDTVTVTMRSPKAARHTGRTWIRELKRMDLA